MATYRSVQNDTLDLICYKHYGTSNLTTEIVMESNPALAKFGPIIPQGTLIELPEITHPIPVKETLQLWD